MGENSFDLLDSWLRVVHVAEGGQVVEAGGMVLHSTGRQGICS